MRPDLILNAYEQHRKGRIEKDACMIETITHPVSVSVFQYKEMKRQLLGFNCKSK